MNNVTSEELIEEGVIAVLSKVFENVKRWLEYEELKSSLLIYIVSAEIALLKFPSLPAVWQSFLGLGLLVLSLIVSLGSFLPKARMPEDSKCHMALKESRHITDLTEQIAVHYRIAIRKSKTFDFAVALAFVAQLLFVCAFYLEKAWTYT